MYFKNWLLTTGYNRIDITPTDVKKGDMVFLYTAFLNHLAIDTSSEALVSDYLISGTKSIKIDLNRNVRMFVSLLVNTKFSLNYFSYSRKFTQLKSDTFEVNNVKAEFVNSPVSLIREYNVTSCKYLIIIYFI